MPSINRMIFNKFRVKDGDNLPYRGWTGDRNTLAELFNDFGYKYGAEIGVRKGEYSKILCDKIPSLQLYCIDPWAPYSMVTSAEKQEQYYEITVKTLKPYPDVRIFRKTSKEALLLFGDNALDFVYIDGAHDFDNVMMDIIEWSKKVRPNGIVAGHDYLHGYRSGIVYAVNAYMQAHNITPWYITRDTEPSWFFVKR